MSCVPGEASGSPPGCPARYALARGADRPEVDVDGDVLRSRRGERIAAGLPGEVRAQARHGALVALGAGLPVVEDEERAARQVRCELRLQLDLLRRDVVLDAVAGGRRARRAA
jgi:hypothetical protein